jgi:hypothetical protein
MYVWIWRRLPGPLLLRVLQSLVLLAIAVTVLFVWVFPRVESALPYSDVTVPAGPSGGPTGVPSAVPSGSPAPPVSGPATLPAD